MLAIFGPDGELLAADDPEWWVTIESTIETGGSRNGVSSEKPGFYRFYELPPHLPRPRHRRQVLVVVAAAEDRTTAAGPSIPPPSPATSPVASCCPATTPSPIWSLPTGRFLPDGPERPYRSGGHAIRASPRRCGEIGATFLDVGADEHVISYTPIAPVGWALVMEEAWREMTEPMLRRTELAPFILLPVLAVALAGLWFGARRIVEPLRALADRAVALGRGDFDALREPVGGIGEIRQLQGELAGMTAACRWLSRACAIISPR
ncbi:MAG: HAMP domain-containing protein [Rhodospirillales bacterium]|nr:HAMP domain-containing protein [Rhodospirillales bacterium]